MTPNENGIDFSKELFSSYVKKQQKALKLLNTLQIKKFKKWEVDWKKCLQIASSTSKQKPWTDIPVFNDLENHKNSPAIYYFTINTKDANTIFECFTAHKKKASEIRLKKGVSELGYYSISHVPRIFSEGKCLYVGSIKKGLHGRAIRHLGFHPNGRTGALYLYQTLKDLAPIPKVTFHYFILGNEFKNLTEHIECVIQDQLKPFIGKRAFKNFLE